MKRVLLATTLLLSGCNFDNYEGKIQSRPEFNPQSLQSHLKRIVLVGTHHFEKHPDILEEQIELKTKSITVKSGGLALLQSYMNILNQKYPDQVLHLNYGSLDGHTGADNNFDVSDLFSHMNVAAQSFSELDIRKFKKNKRVYENLDFPYINTNILNIKENSLLQAKNLVPYHIYEVNGVKVGVMSVSTFKPIDNELKKYKGIYFEDPVFSVLKVKKQLKKEGAQVIVLLVNSRAKTQEVSKLVKRLPHGGVDVIFDDNHTGKNYQENGIYILSDKGKGKYLNYIELIFDKDFNKIDTRKTQLFQPVKLCKDFFKQTNDCYTCETSKRNEKLEEIFSKKSIRMIPAKFLNEVVHKDIRVIKTINSLKAN